MKVLLALTIVLAAYAGSRYLQRFIDRRLRVEGHRDEADVRVYKAAARLIMMVPGILIAVHVLGLNLSSLFTGGGLFALAIAFAMKNIGENYVAGVMLRLERSIKSGDVLEINGVMGKVKDVGLRATVVRTKDERDLLIPNSELVQNIVANYSFKDSICRVWTFIGVSYSSDMKKVREVLERVCEKFPGQSDYHRPQVMLTEFGSSAATFKVSIWIENPWDSGSTKAKLNEAVWNGLKDAGITIAFPQLDLHFDETFTKLTK